MEKWLPDKPDREKWSQEEALTDDDKEAPMAELPGELEDLIGELAGEGRRPDGRGRGRVQQRHRLARQGGRLGRQRRPHLRQQRQGRHRQHACPTPTKSPAARGEGRTGKSSGEFVGDEAVGKGGRKTPSRLTPDPYVKGQIKDHSKDDGGGATGGGKESGQGGEGLEGPRPAGPGRATWPAWPASRPPCATRPTAWTSSSRCSRLPSHRHDKADGR